MAISNRHDIPFQPLRPNLASVLIQLEALCLDLPHRATLSAQVAALSGEDSAAEYLNATDRVIAAMTECVRELQRLKNHRHEWNDNDYCDVCGADGRA